jgi:hypothetical protein
MFNAVADTILKIYFSGKLDERRDVQDYAKGPQRKGDRKVL